MGLKQLPKHSGEYLLEVIMRRYENRSTIMTSNRPLEEWGKLLCDVPTAGAIIHRFLHHAQVIAISGKSYRVKEAPVVTVENKKSRKSNEPATVGAASQGSQLGPVVVTCRIRYGKCSIGRESAIESTIWTSVRQPGR